jgi:hypothetical protein
VYEGSAGADSEAGALARGATPAALVVVTDTGTGASLMPESEVPEIF